MLKQYMDGSNPKFYWKITVYLKWMCHMTTEIWKQMKSYLLKRNTHTCMHVLCEMDHYIQKVLNMTVKNIYQ